MDLNINNVINISVAQAGQGVGQYNTSNLAIFSHETPDPVFADGFKIYLEPSEVGVDFGTDSVTYKMALAVFSQQPNILANGGYLVVIPLLVDETIGEAVSRTSGMVQYFGILSSQVAPAEAELLDDAAVVQTLNKLMFVVSKTASDVDPDEKLDLIQQGGFTHTRALYYGGSTDL